MYYFALKYPWKDEIWTQNGGGLIPSDELMNELSTRLNLTFDWYGFEDVSDGRFEELWDYLNPITKKYDSNGVRIS